MARRTFNIDFEHMAGTLGQHLEGVDRNLTESIEDAYILLHLVWVQIVQQSVAGRGQSKWRVEGAQPPINKKTGKRNKHFSKRPPAKRSTIISYAGEFGWYTWGEFSKSYQRFVLRRNAFELRVREITEAAFGGLGK